MKSPSRSSPRTQVLILARQLVLATSQDGTQSLTSGGAAPSFGNYGNSPIGGVFDAQAFYPPAYCVFVANLLASQPDDDLEAAVTHVFREFGPVWVKIRRDGRIINGRPCRTEKAKAHRLFLLERQYGTLSADEARRVLSQFGHLEACYVATPLERATFRLPEGVVAQFELYENGQSAQIGLRNHGVYRFTAIPQTGFPQVPATISPRSGTANSSANIYIARYEIDDAHYSVATFQPYEPTEKLCFAFIEFENVESAQAAADSKLTPKRLVPPSRVATFALASRTLTPRPQEDNVLAMDFLPALQSPPTRPFGPRASPMSPAISSPSLPMDIILQTLALTAAIRAITRARHTPPAYYSYAGSSPAYAAPPSASSEVSSSPSYQSGYYSYAAYGYPTSPYWNAPPQSVEQSLGNYYAPTQPATTEANVVTPEGTNITSLDGQVSGTTIDVSAQAP
ncbi:hypothetical protein B0O99DRAFT_602078 [Bisporella sp. PMI_857]|nr:hypothetical protein B0O99DRAFT_602078 [Bisporella sp. PMI_857]